MRSPLPSLALLFASSGLCAQQDGVPIMMRYAEFDPVVASPGVPPILEADADSRLHFVQFRTTLTETQRATVHALGVRLFQYVPRATYIARLDPSHLPTLRELDFVRWVGPLHPAYKLDIPLLGDLVSGQPVPPTRYDIVLVAQHRDEGALARAVDRVGGTLHFSPAGGILAEATLTAAQVLEIAGDDSVLWIERKTEIHTDMDNARIQGGAHYLETVAGYTGKGVRGHSVEGIYQSHPEFAATPFRSAPIAVHNSTPYAHGSQVFGVMFARGVVAQARGILPDGQGLYTHFTHFGANSRNSLAADLVDPLEPHQAMFWMSSWGYARTTAYNSRSAEMDQIVFDNDIATIYTMGPSGGRPVRPSAAAKNVVSVGGFFHYNNADPTDDCWCFSGGTGPAADGRIKPELSAFYDSTFTTNGPEGYTSWFGGTSGATPIVAGYLGLAQEIFTDGHFGYPAAPDWQNRFAFRPRFTTAKALVINSARQHTFSGPKADMHRMNQGWGMPSVQDLWDRKDAMLVVDELDVLADGQTRSYWLFVPPGSTEFRATMTHADPAGVPFATVHRINSLDLRVTAPDGTAYWGNNGLIDNMFSTPGGSPNDLDTLENVWLSSPQPGPYRVDVRATTLRADSHVETTAVDADYALVVSGVAGLRDTSGLTLALGSNAPGDLTVSLTGLPSSYAGGFTMLSFATQRPISSGNLFGLEADSTTAAILILPAGPGNPVSFTATTNPSLFPNAPFAFAPILAQALQGVTLDGVAVLYDASGHLVDASNVSRVTVQ